jgi:hypothetical protein
VPAVTPTRRGRTPPEPRYRRSLSELIHTCYRVLDLDRSIAFYEKLGMEEIGRIAIRDEAINVFMGPGLALKANAGL